MKVTIETIETGYLVTTKDQTKAYHNRTNVNEVPKMIEDILKLFQEKGYKLVDEKEAVKLRVLRNE